MKKYNIVSVYTKAKYKNHPKETNEKRIKNHLKRTFNREIVGYSAGKSKDANLVVKAISKINHNLKNHTISYR